MDDDLPPDPPSPFNPVVLEGVARHALAELWRRGHLDVKRDETQKKIRRAIELSDSRSHYLLCSRRLGKSYELFLEAVEVCIQKAGARVLFLAPWAKNASEITEDIAAQIFLDCPDDLRPEYKTQTKEFVFRNESIIRVKGVNGEHAQYLRGGAADLVILDEIGLMNDLRHVISDVVMPMTMTTGGRILLATTPARSPGHESTAIFMEHQEVGAVSRFTILDNVRVPRGDKRVYLLAAGEKMGRVDGILDGALQPETTTAKREYFCEFVTDADTAVLPEFPEAKADIVKIPSRPEYFDTYVAMDPGFNDKTGILYAHVDFMNRKLVIEDEDLLSRAATPDIAKAIKAKERDLWGEKKPLKRICDVDLRLIADLWELHGLTFHSAEKVDSMAGINLLRTMIKGRQIVISPKCERLITQMENAVWDSKGKDMDRTELDGHFDLVAALKYLARGINWQRNPYPEWYGAPGPQMWVSPKRRKKLETGILGETPFARRIVRNRCAICGARGFKCWHTR